MLKRKIARKLNNNQGASLMLALLFFVICAAVGSIFLTAATVSAGRVTDISKDNQYAQALANSRDLLINSLKDSSNNEVLNIKDYPSGKDDEFKNRNGSINYEMALSFPNINSAIAMMAMQVYKSGTYSSTITDGYQSDLDSILLTSGHTDHDGKAYALTRNFTVHCPTAEESDSVDVAVHAHMYQNFDIVLELIAGNETNFTKSSVCVEVPAKNVTAIFNKQNNKLEYASVEVGWDWNNSSLIEGSDS